MIEAKGDSGISVHDSYIDGPLDPDERVVLDETVDTNPNLAAREADLWRFPGERERMNGFGAAYWAAVDPANRGVSDIGR